jgi:hypothetical protein
MSSRIPNIAIAALRLGACRVWSRILQRSRYVSVTLTHGSGREGFYARFGFQVFKDIPRIWKPPDGDPTL